MRAILSTFRDLLLHLLPGPIVQLLVRPVDFIFIIHPRDAKDVWRKYPYLKSAPNRFIHWITLHLWPVLGPVITGLKTREGEPMTGRVVFSPMTAKQMFQDLHLARKRMLKAIRLGEKLGPKVIGLGALSASVMRGKWESLDRVRALITSGSIFTCVLLRQEAEQLSSAVGLELKSSTVAIVGAAGLVGSLASKLLAGRVKRLILVDRRINVLMELSKELMERVKIPIETTKDVAEIRKADLIIAATNAPSAVFTAGDLRPGTLIIDDSRPTSVPLDLMDQRPDVVLIEGGVGRLPEMRCTFDFGLSQKDEVFGCLGETILLCWSKMYERQYLEGKTDLELAEQLSKLSLEMGFKQAHFQWQGQPIGSDRLNIVRNLRSGVTQPV